MPLKNALSKVITFSWGDGVELRFSTDEWHEYYRLAMQLTPRTITMLSSKSGWLTPSGRWVVESRPLENWQPLGDDEYALLTVEELGDFLYAAKDI